MKKTIIFLLMLALFICGSFGVCAEDLNEEISLTEIVEEPEEITFEEAFGEISPEEIGKTGDGKTGDGSVSCVFLLVIL